MNFQSSLLGLQTLGCLNSGMSLVDSRDIH